MEGMRLRPPLRKTVLVVHIGASVALLGEVWALVLLNTLAATGEPALARGAYGLMPTLVFAGGIPLSMTALITGVLLAVTGPWGLTRHYWVLGKLGLLVMTICVGMFLFDPEGMAVAALPAPGRQWGQVAALSLQVVLLLTATAFSVFKPFGRRKIMNP